MHYHPRTIPSSEQRDCGSPTVPGTPIIASAQWDIPSQASWEEGRQEEVKWAHRKIRGRILPPAAPGEWRFVQHLRSDGPGQLLRARLMICTRPDWLSGGPSC